MSSRGATPATEPVISYRRADRSVHRTALSALAPDRLLDSSPWRKFRSHQGQPHYSGEYWSSTTGGHVAYESRLELARLILADFDPTVISIAAQPFLIEHDGRRHVPDYLLGDAGGLLCVVNVKPADRLTDPKVRRALRWAGELFESQGWRAEVWCGIDPIVMANVRFLAGYRRSALMRPELVDRVAEVARAGDSIGDIERRLAPIHWSESRPAILHLVWRSVLSADLSSPLQRETELGFAA